MSKNCISRRISRQVVLSLAVVMAAGYCGSSTRADTTETIWQDAAPDWSVPTDWNNGVPSATVSAEFNTTTAYTNQPTLSAASTSQGIWVTGASGGVTTTISGANPLTITGTATLDSVANAGILLDGVGNNNLTIDSSVTNLTNTNSTSYMVNNGGTLTINSGLMITAGKILTLGGTGTAGSITINGNIATSTGALTLDAAGTITLTGTNSQTGITTIGTANGNTANGIVMISNGHALGAGPVNLYSGYQTTALVTLEASTDLTGDNAILNDVVIGYGSSTNPSHYASVGGNHSIEFSGGASLSSNNLLVNNIDSAKALTFSGTIALPTGAFNILNIEGTGNTIITGKMTGGNITLASTGTLTISNSGNTYNGITLLTPNGGSSSLIVGSDTALGTSTIDLYSGTTFTSLDGAYATLQASTDVTLANNIVIANGSGGARKVGVVGGSHNITVNGTASTGTTTTFVNNMTGGAGFTFGNAGGLSIGSSSITFVGPGAVVVTGGFTGIGASTGAGVTYSGTSVLTVGGTSNYAGGTAVTSGTLKTTSGGALSFGGAVSKPGATTVSTGGTLDVFGQTITEPITLNGGNLINTGAAATLTDGVKGAGISTTTTTIQGDQPVTISYTGGGGSGAAAVGLLGVNASTFTINPGSSGYGISKSNLAVVSITGGGGTGATATANTDSTGAITSITITNAGIGYTSAPTITFAPPTTGTTATGTGNNAFSLVAIQQTSAGSGYITAPTATFSATGGTATLSTPVIASIKLTGTSNTIGGTGDITINSIISNTSTAAGFTKTGPDVLTLNAANTYTGGTTITGGTLVAGSTKALGSGNVSVNGGTLELDPPVNIGAGNFILTSGTLKLDLATDPTNALAGTGTSTYLLGNSTTVDLGIGAAPFDYGSVYNILTFSAGSVGNISITDYDAADWSAAIADNGSGTAVLSFTAASPIPEPASLALLGLAGLPLVLRRRRSSDRD